MNHPTVRSLSLYYCLSRSLQHTCNNLISNQASTPSFGTSLDKIPIERDTSYQERCHLLNYTVCCFFPPLRCFSNVSLFTKIEAGANFIVRVVDFNFAPQLFSEAGQSASSACHGSSITSIINQCKRMTHWCNVTPERLAPGQKLVKISWEEPEFRDNVRTFTDKDMTLG